MLFYSLSFVKYIPYLIGFIMAFRIVCRWFIFRKMSVRPWLSIIPVVSDFITFRRCWKVWPFVVLLVLAVVLGLYVQITGYLDIYLPIPPYIKKNMMILAIICLLAIKLLLYKHLAFAFGHDIGYVMGLLFLNPIFLGIMAFSKDTFHEELTKLRGKDFREYTNQNRTLANRILSAVSAVIIVCAGLGYIGYVMVTEQQPAFLVNKYLSKTYEKTAGKVSGRGQVVYPALDDGVIRDVRVRSYYFPDKSKVKETTVYMYLIGSNMEDSSGSASINLAQIKDATAAGKNLKFIIEAGGTGRWFTDGFKNNKTGRYMIKNGEVTLLELLPDDTCMSKQKTLQDLLLWANKKYPSDRKMLFFWDHGGGLAGYGVDALNPRADQKMLSLTEIVGALDASGEKYDLIGFDACLMQTMEVGLSLEPYADYLLASEESEPTSGLYYTAAFTRLTQEPDLSTLKFGAMMCSSFDQSLDLLNGVPQAGATMSMTDLRYMPVVAETFVGYLSSLDRNFRTDKKSFMNMSTARSQSYEFQMEDQIDLIDFIDKSSLTDWEKSEMINRIKSAIPVRNAASANHINGLAVYMPYDDLDAYTNAYETMETLGMKPETRVYNDFASIIGSQKRTKDGKKTGEYKYEKWYVKDFENYDITTYKQDVPLIDMGGKYAIDLTDEEWETITGYEQGLQMKVGSRYVDLGSDNVFDLDEKGHYMLEFNDTWVAINDVVVALHPGTPKDVGGGKIIYSGTVDATLNYIFPIKIYIEWVDIGDKEGEGVVLGYLPADEDSDDIDEKGMPRGIKQFKTSNIVTFLYDWYDEEGNYLSTAMGHLPINVGMYGLEVTQKDISDQDYYYYGLLKDVLNGTIKTQTLHHEAQ